MSSNRKKIALVATFLLLISAAIYFDVHNALNLENLKKSRDFLIVSYEKSPLITIVAYTLLYVLVTSLSLPGAAVLTLAGGAIFGLLIGVLLVSLASTIGATLAFLSSRFLISAWVRDKFREKLVPIDKGIRAEGGFYLFGLRLVPIFPFFMINLLMGLTPLTVKKFFFISQLGMLPGTIVYVNAGTQLGMISSLAEIASFEILTALSLLGLFPIVAKKILVTLRKIQ